MEKPGRLVTSRDVDINLHWTLAAEGEARPDGVGYSTAYLDNYSLEEHLAVEAVFRLQGMAAARDLRQGQREARRERLNRRWGFK